MALDSADELLKRDVAVVDMRDPRRPMLRLTAHAVDGAANGCKSTAAGEDA